MKPTAIITADIGLQEGQPICRLDSHWEAQARKILWLKKLQEKHGCPILDGGDLFEVWKSSPNLERWALQNLPDGICTIPGNHDLKAHNIQLYEQGSLAVLEAAEKITVISKLHTLPLIHSSGKFTIVGFPWGVPVCGFDKEKAKRDLDIKGPIIALVHAMTYVGRSPFPGCKDPGALSLLKKMSGFDLIIIGHNHKPFIVEHEGRKLISPGSLTRTTADQADYKPCVYLWYAEDNSIEAIPVPIEADVISREHIDVVENKEARISAFVERLGGEFEVSLSFKNNLQNFFGKNRVRKAVQDLVWGAVDTGQ